MNLGTLHEVVVGMQKENAQLHEALSNVNHRMDNIVEGFQNRCSMLEAELARQSALIVDLTAMVTAMAEKVNATNKSAAVKRNMTTDDAQRVMDGDLKGKSHKDAAEVLGITYAQVYSARLGFTFKEVSHELEKRGWKNPWEKKAQNR